MNETTAQFLASLSHRWSLLMVTLPFVFAVAAHGSGKLLDRARASGNSRRRTIALVGRILVLTLLSESLIGFVLSVSHVGCAAVAAHSTQCLSNLKQLATGTLLYAQDYDGRLPPAPVWAGAIENRAKGAVQIPSAGDRDIFQCPGTDSPGGYGMNLALSAGPIDTIDAPIRTVLFFDADATTAAFAGGSMDIARQRHSETPNIVFTDGHAQRANPSVLDNLNWSPTSASGRL